MKNKDNKIFLEALDELEKEKGINREEMLQSIETALYTAYKKQFQDVENARVEINRDTGDVKIFAIKEVVAEDDVNTNKQIGKNIASKLKKGIKVGSEIKIELDAENFKRTAIQNAKQMVIQKVREFEKQYVYKIFKEIEHSLVTAVIRKTDENGNLYVEINSMEAIIFKNELTDLDKFKQGDKAVVYVGDILEGNKYNKINLSRKAPELLLKLFEREVPEISEGLIEIKSIAREPGVRSKVAIYSKDPNLDLKGACIGKNGTRISNIINELKGEKIDLVVWDEDIRIFVKNALNPAEINSIEIIKNDNDEIIAKVEVDNEQLSLAIGKKGQNTRLANKLCNIKIVVEVSENALTENKEVINDENGN